jgi:hypothetical protein
LDLFLLWLRLCLGLIFFLNQVTEDVIEHKVAIGLSCEHERLSELAVRLTTVAELTDDLDDNVGVGSLRIDVGDADFAIGQVELSNLVIDRALTDTHGYLVSLLTGDELRTLVVEEIEFFGAS